jgi:hypothetical protein
VDLASTPHYANKKNPSFAPISVILSVHVIT